MKQKLMLICTIGLCISIPSFAQNTSKVSGQFNDNNGKAVSAANIMLQKAKDSSLVKMAITDGKGYYEIQQVKPGQYFVSATASGFIKTSSAIF
jgi:hypothetical protein